jgi:hypothetical protein
MKDETLIFGIFGVWLALLVVAAVGWLANVGQLIRFAATNPPLNDITLMVILKIIGVIFAPLGVILGYIGMGW